MTVCNPYGIPLFSRILSGMGMLRQICLEEPLNKLLFFEIMLKSILEEITVLLVYLNP